MAATQDHTPKPGLSKHSKQRTPRVIAKKLLGKSNRQIAREEKMDPHTVGKILSDAEYREAVNAYRSEVVDLIPKSLQLYMKAVKTALGEEPIPEDMVPSQEAIQVLDRDQLKAMMARAFQRGVATGQDAIRAATEALKGSQVFVPKQETKVELTDDLTKKDTDQLSSELEGMDG